MIRGAADSLAFLLCKADRLEMISEPRINGSRTSMNEMKTAYNKMKKEIYLPLFCIIFGEVMILDGELYYGMAIRLITLVVIFIKIISKNLELETKIILKSFILLILLQIINLSMPRLFNNNLQQYLLIYGSLTLPIYSIIKNAGINFRKQTYYIFAALLIGTVTIIFEYRMLTINIISINGEFASIFLVVLLSISFLLSDTEYWNNTLDICSVSLTPMFIANTIYNII